MTYVRTITPDSESAQALAYDGQFFWSDGFGLEKMDASGHVVESFGQFCYAPFAYGAKERMIVEQEQLKNTIDSLKIEVKAISNSYRSYGTPIDEDNLPLPLMIRLKSLQMAQARYDEIEQTLQSADDLTEVEILIVDVSSYDDFEELFALFLVGDAHPTTAMREKQGPKKISAVSS